MIRACLAHQIKILSSLAAEFVMDLVVQISCVRVGSVVASDGDRWEWRRAGRASPPQALPSQLHRVVQAAHHDGLLAAIEVRWHRQKDTADASRLLGRRRARTVGRRIDLADGLQDEFVGKEGQQRRPRKSWLRRGALPLTVAEHIAGFRYEPQQRPRH